VTQQTQLSEVLPGAEPSDPSKLNVGNQDRSALGEHTVENFAEGLDAVGEVLGWAHCGFTPETLTVFALAGKSSGRKFFLTCLYRGLNLITTELPYFRNSWRYFDRGKAVVLCCMSYWSK